MNRYAIQYYNLYLGTRIFTNMFSLCCWLILHSILPEPNNIFVVVVVVAKYAATSLIAINPFIQFVVPVTGIKRIITEQMFFTLPLSPSELSCALCHSSCDIFGISLVWKYFGNTSRFWCFQFFFFSFFSFFLFLGSLSRLHA